LGLSIWKVAIIGGIVMVLFGRGKVSELMGDVAKGIKSFKKGMAEDDQVADEPRVITRDPAQPVNADRVENNTKVS
jgi:sec-independent protein translocase protein TatA